MLITYLFMSMMKIRQIKNNTVLSQTPKQYKF